VANSGIDLVPDELRTLQMLLAYCYATGEVTARGIGFYLIEAEGLSGYFGRGEGEKWFSWQFPLFCGP
jgi:hypothetical protein